MEQHSKMKLGEPGYLHVKLGEVRDERPHICAKYIYKLPTDLGFLRITSVPDSNIIQHAPELNCIRANRTVTSSSPDKS